MNIDKYYDIPDDFELLKREIKRRLNIYDSIRSEFEESKMPVTIIYRDWIEIDK